MELGVFCLRVIGSGTVAGDRNMGLSFSTNHIAVAQASLGRLLFGTIFTMGDIGYLLKLCYLASQLI